jgi:hypothetical protein
MWPAIPYAQGEVANANLSAMELRLRTALRSLGAAPSTLVRHAARSGATGARAGGLPPLYYLGFLLAGIGQPTATHPGRPRAVIHHRRPVRLLLLLRNSRMSGVDRVGFGYRVEPSGRLPSGLGRVWETM